MFRSRLGGLDSLMRQLLSVNCLQPEVIHLLLLRLSNYMDTTSSSLLAINVLFRSLLPPSLSLLLSLLPFIL